MLTTIVFTNSKIFSILLALVVFNLNIELGAAGILDGVGSASLIIDTANK
jgi:hypothetical protein